MGYTGYRQSAEGWAAWFRSFDTQMARWLSEDPGIRFAASYGATALPSGPNFFAYSRNSPARYTDPAGLDPGALTWPVVKLCVEVGSAAAALLGGAIGMALSQCGDGCRPPGKWTCLARAVTRPAGDRAPKDFESRFIEAIGSGNTEAAARKDAIRRVQALSPLGTHAGHPHIIWCKRR